MNNLVLLCRNHHRLVHEGGYGVHARAEQDIHFTMPDGKILSTGPDTRFSGNVMAIERANRENGLDITPKTAIPAWGGEQMDKSMAVNALIQRE